MARRLEVRITYCCCCGLTLATAFIALYTLILYLIFLGTASSALWRIDNGVKDPVAYERTSETIVFNEIGREVLVENVERGDPYYDSLGLYMEEMKFTTWTVRRAVLAVNIVIYLLVIIASILVFVALATKIHFLLLPWIVIMIIDIIRGIISVILIFVYSQGSLRQIAVGIFFLGLQLFHMALVLIMFAKFLRMMNKKQGVDYKVVEKGDHSILTGGSQVYPTLPGTNYPYNTSSPQPRRDGGYFQPQGTQYPYASEADLRQGPSQPYYNSQPQLNQNTLPPRQHQPTY